MFFPAVPVQESRAALHQLVEDPFVLIARAADRYAQRFFPCAGAAGHGLPLAKAALPRPAGHLVTHVQHGVVAFAFPVAERQLLDGGIGFRDVQPAAFRAPGAPAQIRLMVHVKLKSPETEISLIQFRSQVIYFRSKLTGSIGHIVPDPAGQQRLALLPAYDQHHLGKLPVALRVHDPKDQREGRLLPQAQLQPAGCQRPFVVVAVGLDEPDAVIGLPGIEVPALALQPVHNHVVQLADPFTHHHAAVHDGLVILEDGVLVAHILNCASLSSREAADLSSANPSTILIRVTTVPFAAVAVLLYSVMAGFV